MLCPCLQTLKQLNKQFLVQKLLLGQKVFPFVARKSKTIFRLFANRTKASSRTHKWTAVTHVAPSTPNQTVEWVEVELNYNNLRFTSFLSLSDGSYEVLCRRVECFMCRLERKGNKEG